MNSLSEKLANPRSARFALWGGIAFSLIFTAIIYWAGDRLNTIQLLPDQGASWYYWKLPVPSVVTRLTAWGLYMLHQVSFWSLIWYGQTRVKKYAGGIHSLNLWALGVNALFILLHFIQTHLFYDGLAQDVSIWSSQASVVIMLVAILLMENKRRGLFFGSKVPFSKRIISFIRTYHGYLFAWATVYTFWYHPMVNTAGHLIGFLYMFLLLLQGSLFLTRIHLNKWWMLVQEVSVAFHGTLVAIMQGNNIWPMFAFGFSGIFIITQMHGLGLKRWVRGCLLVLYIVAAIYIYSERGWIQMNEIIRIPLIEYLAVFILAGLIGLGIWISGRLSQTREISPASD